MIGAPASSLDPMWAPLGSRSSRLVVSAHGGAVVAVIGVIGVRLAAGASGREPVAVVGEGS